MWVMLVTLGLLISSSVPLALSTPLPDLQLIESDNPIVQRSGTWTYQDTPNASSGGYLFSSGSVEDALELHFTGTSIDITYVKHPSLGIFAIEIDDIIVRTVNSYSEETEFGAVSSVTYLDDEPHVLRIYPSSGVIAIDAFQTQPIFSVPVYTSDFALLTGWQLLNKPLPSEEPPSGTLDLDGLTQIAAFVAAPQLDEFIIEADVLVNSGEAELKTNGNGVGYYAVTLSDTGNMNLYHNQTILASASIPAFTAETWYQIKLHVANNILLVSVDNTVLIRAVESSLVPAGIVVWARETVSDIFHVDNFTLWIPTSDMPETPQPPLIGAELEPLASSETLTGLVVFNRWDNNTPNDSGIYIMNADGSGEHKIPNTFGSDLMPELSPDGSQIVFSSSTGGLDFDLYVVNVDGSARRKLTTGVQGTWSPNGQKIAYNDRFGPSSQIRVITDLSCSYPCPSIQITPTAPDGNDYTVDMEPSWGPDNESLVFLSNWALADYSPSRGVRILLPGGVENQGYTSPQWSPTVPNRVIAQVYNLSVSYIAIMDGVGTENGDMTVVQTYDPTVSDEYSLAWASEGWKFAFNMGSSNDIHFIDAATNVQGTLVTSPLFTSSYDVSWRLEEPTCPDGYVIVQGDPLSATCTPQSRVYAAIDGIIRNDLPSNLFSQNIQVALNDTGLALRDRLLGIQGIDSSEAFDRVMFGTDQPDMVIGFVFYDPTKLTGDTITPISIDTNLLRLPDNEVDQRGGYDLVCPYMVYWPDGSILGGTYNHDKINDYIESLVNIAGYGGKPHKALIACDKTRADQTYVPQFGAPAINRFNTSTAIFHFGQLFFEVAGGGSDSQVTYASLIAKPAYTFDPIIIDPYSLYDFSGYVVMGFHDYYRDCTTPITFWSDPNACASVEEGTYRVNDWSRGTRGWSSDMWNQFPNGGCFFQQDALFTYDAPPYDDWRLPEVRAAAADMFLDWVKATPPLLRNKKWGQPWESHDCALAGLPDDTNAPGEARLGWMEQVVMPTLQPIYWP